MPSIGTVDVVDSNTGNVVERVALVRVRRLGDREPLRARLVAAGANVEADGELLAVSAATETVFAEVLAIARAYWRAEVA